MTVWSDAVAALSPYAWWRLGEASGTTAADSSGNGRNGTYQSTGNITYGVASLVAGGTDNNAATMVTTAANVTAASLSYSSVNVTYALSVKSATDQTGRLFQGTSFNYLAFGTTTTTGNVNISNAPSLGYDPTALFDGNPHLIVYKVGATTVQLWVDGVMVGSGTHAAPGETITSVSMKQPSGGPTGTFDEFLIFNSQLSSTQIGDLYTAWQGSVAAGTVTLGATLRSKTAAFTAGVIVAGTLAGTLQAKTAAFTLDVPAAPDRTVSLSATLPQKTADITLLAGADATLAGTLRARTAAFAVLGAADVALAGELQPKTAALTMESGKTVTLTGALRRKTSVIDIHAQPAVRLAATMRAKTAAFTVTTLPTVVLAATLQQKIATVVTYAVTPVTAPPLLASSGHSVVVGRALGPVTMNGTQPVYSVSAAEIARARQQIVVDGVDVSFFRDVVTPNVSYTLLAPLRYGPGQLDLPQVAACFEVPGEGALSFLREGAPVEVNLVLDDPAGIDPAEVVGTVYKGVIVAFDLSGRELSVELGGEASGRAALRDRQAVLFPRVNDIGHQISDDVRDLGLPVYPALGTVTGIEVMTTGGVGHDEHIQNLCAQAWTRQGKYWTVMPNEAGAYEVRQKSDTVIHGTVFFDDARTVARIRRDLAEEPNRIFITGVTPQGQRVRFGVYPGLIQGPVPDFPGHMENGDTGEGVRLLIGKLHAVGYLRLYEVSGGYDLDVVEAVKDLQADAGLPKTGEVDLATWEALYDLNVTTTSLEAAHIEPAAQDPRVQRYHRSGSGTILEFNDGYDPEVLPRDRTIDAGVGKTRSQLREFARTVLEAATTPNWVGDIVFNTGALLSGDRAIGTTVTPDMVWDARLLVPTMNLWAPGFDGGTQFNVSACQVAADGTVTATVDTRFRDALEVWEIIDRNRESRNDPARRRNQKHRSSTIRKDSIGEWDEIGGLLGHDVRLGAKKWTEFEVVAAMEGQIAWLKIVLDNPAAFAVAAFGRSGGADLLNDVIPEPLAAGGAKKWQTHRDALGDRGLLYSAGTPDEPCGYHPGRKADDDPITGRFLDDAGFRYWSEDRCKVYVAVWVDEENVIPLGRIMRNQLEAGA